MEQNLLKWLKNAYRKVVTSIAFLPAVIALCLFALCFLMIQLDFSSAGKNIKSNLSWLSLKDASTARSICTAIASGVISLTVFSFSMVMILLSQAASQMSNRILAKLISNRFQQVVLGFYIGTIIYALFLLSTIRDIDTGIHVPAISTYSLISLTISDIFLFIYFLHYITDSVKYETIISRIYDDTIMALKKHCTMPVLPTTNQNPSGGIAIAAQKSGLFRGFEPDKLVDICQEENVIVRFLYPVGTFLIEKTPLLMVSGTETLPKDLEIKLALVIDIGKGTDIKTSYYFGFRQLMEIAIKALSPGINDPGTAVIALQALGDLLAYRLSHFPESYFNDENKVLRVVSREKDFAEIFSEYILPIWDYGKSDRMIRIEMLHILKLIELGGTQQSITTLLREVELSIKNA